MFSEMFDESSPLVNERSESKRRNKKCKKIVQILICFMIFVIVFAILLGLLSFLQLSVVGYQPKQANSLISAPKQSESYKVIEEMKRSEQLTKQMNQSIILVPRRMMGSPRNLLKKFSQCLNLYLEVDSRILIGIEDLDSSQTNLLMQASQQSFYHNNTEDIVDWIHDNQPNRLAVFTDRAGCEQIVRYYGCSEKKLYTDRPTVLMRIGAPLNSCFLGELMCR